MAQKAFFHVRGTGLQDVLVVHQFELGALGFDFIPDPQANAIYRQVGHAQDMELVCHHLGLGE